MLIFCIDIFLVATYLALIKYDTVELVEIMIAVLYCSEKFGRSNNDLKIHGKKKNQVLPAEFFSTL